MLFSELLMSLHDKLGRLPQFEIYVAHRFFLLSSREPFFSPVQQNSTNLDRKIRSIAWDLAHWRSLLRCSPSERLSSARLHSQFRTSCHSTEAS